MRKIIRYNVLILFSLLLFSCLVQSQEKSMDKSHFIRVYDLDGKKLAKGRLINVSDTQITLQRGKKTESLAISSIGYMRTKRSVGHNALIGAAAGTAVAAITFASQADPDAWIFGYTAGEGILVGFILGAPAGAATGALSALFKNSEQFEINGQADRWKQIMPHFKQ